MKFLLSFHSLKKCNALENVHLAILKDFPRVLCNKSWSKKFTTAYKLFSICAIHFSHTRYEFAIAYVLYIPPQRNITYIHCNIIGHSKLVHDQVNTKFLNGGNVYDTLLLMYFGRSWYITYIEHVITFWILHIERTLCDSRVTIFTINICPISLGVRGVGTKV